MVKSFVILIVWVVFLVRCYHGKIFIGECSRIGKRFCDQLCVQIDKDFMDCRCQKGYIEDGRICIKVNQGIAVSTTDNSENADDSKDSFSGEYSGDYKIMTTNCDNEDGECEDIVIEESSGEDSSDDIIVSLESLSSTVKTPNIEVIGIFNSTTKTPNIEVIGFISSTTHSPIRTENVIRIKTSEQYKQTEIKNLIMMTSSVSSPTPELIEDNIYNPVYTKNSSTAKPFLTSVQSSTSKAMSDVIFVTTSTRKSSSRRMTSMKNEMTSFHHFTSKPSSHVTATVKTIDKVLPSTSSPDSFQEVSTIKAKLHPHSSLDSSQDITSTSTPDSFQNFDTTISSISSTVYPLQKVLSSIKTTIYPKVSSQQVSPTTTIKYRTSTLYSLQKVLSSFKTTLQPTVSSHTVSSSRIEKLSSTSSTFSSIKSDVSSSGVERKLSSISSTITVITIPTTTPNQDSKSTKVKKYTTSFPTPFLRTSEGALQPTPSITQSNKIDLLSNTIVGSAKLTTSQNSHRLITSVAPSVSTSRASIDRTKTVSRSYQHSMMGKITSSVTPAIKSTHNDTLNIYFSNTLSTSDSSTTTSRVSHVTYVSTTTKKSKLFNSISTTTRKPRPSVVLIPPTNETLKTKPSVDIIQKQSTESSANRLQCYISGLFFIILIQLLT